MSIVEKYRYRLTEQSSGEDQVDSAISVDITRRDLKTADTGDNLEGLAPACGELQLNPVVSSGEVGSSSLNAGQVRTEVAVKIIYRKRQPRPCRNASQIPGIRVCLYGAAKEGQEQQ